jgi:hypothetical protein
MDTWGDPPADYSPLAWKRADEHYGERWNLPFAGPGYSDPPAGPDKNFDESGFMSSYSSWMNMGGYEPSFFQIYPQMVNARNTTWAAYETELTDGAGGTAEDYLGCL